MHNRTIAGFLLIPALVVVVSVVLAINRERIADRFEKLNDDPQLFCSQPDPSPVAEGNGASLILQDCAAGKINTVPRGGTIAVDLIGSSSADTKYEFRDLSVSDPSILQTVVAPKTIDSDYFALYQGVRSGRVTITATYRYCFNDKCVDSMLWETTAVVS
jgi:hypothetical protein